jgi:N utilization substance protein A
VESLADMTPEELEAIPGIDAETIERISIAVNNYFSTLEAAEPEVSAEPAAVEFVSDPLLASEEADAAPQPAAQDEAEAGAEAEAKEEPGGPENG